VNVATVGVCGAGVMGSGIAEAFARGGWTVLLHDAEPDRLAAGHEALRARIERDVGRGRLEEDRAAAAREAVRAVASPREFATAGLVVEAVVESLEVKRVVFGELERVCAPSALLATNTSTLSPTEIAAPLDDPGRVAGFHFFNPAARMELVEVIAGQRTSPRTVARLREVAESIGKTPVSVNESPGGIVSRLQLLVRNEAVRLLAEGVASAEDIDTAMRLGAGWPMGPLELTDLVGLDVHVTNSDSLSEEMGSNRYRPHPMLRKMVRAGRLGRKSGGGLRGSTR
jgi:3-hydroxybutyryl-CoA dehydrogenase